MKKVTGFLSKINYIFNRKEKVQLVLLLFAILITTVLELAGVVAIMPFINVVMDPASIEKTAYLKWLYTSLAFGSTNGFIAFLGMLLIVIYIIKNVAISLMYYSQYAFTFNTQKKLCGRMLKCYLNQPYIFHLQNNSAKLINNIKVDVSMMFQAIISILGLLSELVVSCILGVYLLIQDKSIVIGVLAIMGMVVLLFGKKYKRYLRRLGAEDREYNVGIMKWLQQSFGGMKETKILGREEYFYSKFEDNYSNWAEREKIFRLMQIIPRPAMETFLVTALLGVIVLKLLNGTQSAYFISTLSVFAVAVVRLLPSINRITTSYGVVMFNMPAFDSVYKDLKEIEQLVQIDIEKNKVKKGLRFEQNIEIRDVTFGYPEKENNVLENINLKIRKCQSIALIGPSGAGKTTLADIVLGILKPTKGQVLVDGLDIDECPNEWKEKLGYIPQSIYLMDDTIRNNILYGNQQCNDEQLWKAIEEAQLKEFILSLENGLDTIIGENGICLSGGQRQRIGIARALYTNPEVLVLDEATSALDNETEEAVMEAINHLTGSKTLIIIAHRLSTTEKCDVIFEVKDRQVTQIK